MRQSRRLFLRTALGTGVLGANASAQIAPRIIEIGLVDDTATGYGTFQSYNQKVVSNTNGVFMTHIRSRDREFRQQQWRLSHTRNGGKTFETVFESTDATNPPVL